MKRQINERTRKLKGYMAAGMRALFTGFLIASLTGTKAYAEQELQPGTYLVTVSPSYKDPETGEIEDPGNNEAVGQGMTEKLCGPLGLLEVDTSGTVYLTVRYYLSQFVSDVSFEERSSGSYSGLSHKKMQVKEPVEGADNIDDKYGYTDYRMKISSMNSTFRGKAYIDPMGRSVVYFFSISNPLQGSGDFITTAGQTSVAESSEPFLKSSAEDITESDAELQNNNEEEITEEKVERSLNEKEGAGESGYDAGKADDSVTGIPSKYAEANKVSNEDASGYDLKTSIDLSAVPVAEAKKLTAPLLKSAVGITGMTGDLKQEQKKSLTAFSGNQIIMFILLGTAGGLLLPFAAAAIRRKRIYRTAKERDLQGDGG